MVEQQIPFNEQLAGFLKDQSIPVEVFCARIFESTDGAVEVAASTVSRWLSGETTPRGGTQRAIAKVMGVPVQDLFPTD